MGEGYACKRQSGIFILDGICPTILANNNNTLDRRYLLNNFVDHWKFVVCFPLVRIILYRNENFRFYLQEAINNRLRSEIGRAARPYSADRINCKKCNGCFGNTWKIRRYTIARFNALLLQI